MQGVKPIPAINEDGRPSSDIRTMARRERDETWEIEFQNGSVYQYYPNMRAAEDRRAYPTATLWKDFMAAPSKGRFFNKFIRNARGMVYRKVKSAPPKRKPSEEKGGGDQAAS